MEYHQATNYQATNYQSWQTGFFSGHWNASLNSREFAIVS